MNHNNVNHGLYTYLIILKELVWMSLPPSLSLSLSHTHTHRWVKKSILFTISPFLSDPISINSVSNGLPASWSPPPGGARVSVGSLSTQCWRAVSVDALQTKMTDSPNISITCQSAPNRLSSVAETGTSLDLDKQTGSHHTSLTLTTVCLVWTVGYGNLLDFYSSNWLSGPNMWGEEVVLSSLLG